MAHPKIKLMCFYYVSDLIFLKWILFLAIFWHCFKNILRYWNHINVYVLSSDKSLAVSIFISESDVYLKKTRNF